MHYVVWIAAYIMINHCHLLEFIKPGTRRPQFLKIFPVRMSVCVFVCPPPRLLITCGMIWTPYNWLNKFYSRYMAIVVVIVNGRGLGIDTRHSH